jgi:mono/diheme cytochrome c family protein
MFLAQMRLLLCFNRKAVWRLLIAILAVFGPASGFAQSSATSPAEQQPGLSITYTSLEAGKEVDVVAVPNVWLYVPSGKPPTPFLPAGKFKATWSGSIKVEKRANYLFQAELNGALKLELNGEVVLDVSTNGITEISKPVQLNKGANALKVQFTSPARGDAFVRLHWQPKDSFLQPIPSELLTPSADMPEAKQSAKLHQGRELFLEFRCAKCHAGPALDSTVPELSMDAPTLEGIGSRRNYDWMARWIQDPKALRPTAHMPKVLHGSKAKEDAASIATYLASLKTDEKVTITEPTSDQVSAGKKLFESLHCAACHNAPDANEADAAKIVLKQVREKFVPGTLATFLQKPDAHYVWIRMPNFKLSQQEADQLAAYLTSCGDKSKEAAASTDTAMLERGKKLVQTSGCLNCHTLKLDNQFSTKSLADLTLDKWKQGCLAAASDDAGKSPHFTFTPDEREALQAFAATDRTSLTRHVPVEFAERQTRSLNCRECHGKFEGFPAFDILGGKLKPEWSKAFIAGEITIKPRPWLDARMPAFAKRAESIAQGLVMQHGYPPQTPAESPIDQEAVKVGQKLVSAAGGFSCVMCHAIGEMKATQVFEVAGINLALSGSRLMKPYVHRWIRYPQLIDPATKMPLYFDDEGKSPFADIYGGDSTKQIEAIWQYLRLGDKMPPPPTQ